MRRRSIAIGILILIGSYGGLKLNGPKNISYEEEELVVEKKLKKGRLPASNLSPAKSMRLTPRSDGPQFILTERQPAREEPTVDESPIIGISIEPAAMSWTLGGKNNSGRSSKLNWESKSKNDSNSIQNSNKTTSTPIYSGLPNPNSGTKKETNESDPETPTCSVNTTGGSFQKPITIELTCSTASTIKYCISENTCCDPDQGTVYIAPFVVGQAEKLFCLSFSGTSIEDEITSDTKEAFYSFNPELPHLEVIQEKTNLQTTQLNGLMILTSNDFGSDHHSMGVINLKSHDPSPQNLNMSCQEIIENHASLGTPSPSFALPELSVVTYSPQSQMNLFLTGSNLVYGENYLTAYLKSMLYFVPQYSCSTSKLILEDFNYFQTLPMEQAISNDNQELFGGFSSIGSVEGNTEVYRGPASTIDTTSNEELRTGLLSVFFDK